MHAKNTCFVALALFSSGVQAFAASGPRVEALDAGIVRIWFSPGGDFSRKPSLALEEAPAARVPLADSLVVRADSSGFPSRHATERRSWKTSAFRSRPPCPALGL
jgi:hypothetical protein